MEINEYIFTGNIIKFDMSSEGGSDVIAEPSVCARCGKPVRVGLKCIKCGTLSHRSCLKMLKNTVFLENDEVICCDENGEQASEKSSVPTTPANVPAETNIIDQIKIRYLEELLKQKDQTIKNQDIAIQALNEQVALMKLLIPSSDNTRENSSSKSSSQAFSSVVGTNDVPVKNAPAENRIITKSAVAGTLHKVESQRIFDRIIHLDKENVPQTTRHPRRDRTILVGSKDNLPNCPLKSAPLDSYKSYHAMNLHPQTDKDELLKYLAEFAPSVQVEKLNSRQPTKYASFKISVSSGESQNILDSEIWPKDVILSLFLTSRKPYDHAVQRSVV